MTNIEMARPVKWDRPIVSGLRMLGVTPLGLLAFIAIAISPLFVTSNYSLHLIISSLMFGTLAMAFDFTAGFINIVNFGFGAFWGVGAYTSALLAIRLGLPPWAGMLAGAAVASLLGLLTGVLTLRLRGIFAAVMAWFLGLTLMALAANLVELTRGHLGLNVPLFFETAERTPYLYALLPVTAITYIVLRLVTRSHIGLAFKAIGQDLEAAQASGVNPTKYKVINFTLSCAFAGLLGGYYAHFVGILTPDIMHTKHTVEILAIAYLGGRGSIWGPLAAAFLLIPTLEYLKWLMEIRLIIYGLLLIVVMIYYPGGVAAACQNLASYSSRALRRLHRQRGDSSAGDFQAGQAFRE